MSSTLTNSFRRLTLTVIWVLLPTRITYFSAAAAADRSSSSSRERWRFDPRYRLQFVAAKRRISISEFDVSDADSSHSLQISLLMRSTQSRVAFTKSPLEDFLANVDSEDDIGGGQNVTNWKREGKMVWCAGGEFTQMWGDIIEGF